MGIDILAEFLGMVLWLQGQGEGGGWIERPREEQLCACTMGGGARQTQRSCNYLFSSFPPGNTADPSSGGRQQTTTRVLFIMSVRSGRGSGEEEEETAALVSVARCAAQAPPLGTGRECCRQPAVAAAGQHASVVWGAAAPAGSPGCRWARPVPATRPAACLCRLHAQPLPANPRAVTFPHPPCPAPPAAPRSTPARRRLMKDFRSYVLVGSCSWAGGWCAGACRWKRQRQRQPPPPPTP